MGVRADVNEELKCLRKFAKKIEGVGRFEGGRGVVRVGGVRVGGSGWM